jgi:predicted molibdopterin-dependent oxidoreductase YjgC
MSAANINPSKQPRQNRLGSNHRGMKSAPLPRITEPMVRDLTTGILRPASWEEALDRAAAGFAANRANHGRNAFGIFSCSKSTNEMNYVAQKFARVVMGTNNIDSCNRT